MHTYFMHRARFAHYFMNDIFAQTISAKTAWEFVNCILHISNFQRMRKKYIHVLLKHFISKLTWKGILKKQWKFLIINSLAIIPLSKYYSVKLFSFGIMALTPRSYFTKLKLPSTISLKMIIHYRRTCVRTYSYVHIK